MKIETKYNLRQELYAIVGNFNCEISKVKVEKIRAIISLCEDECLTCYSCTNDLGYALSVFEEQLFETREEAEKQIKELRGIKNED